MSRTLALALFAASISMIACKKNETGNSAAKLIFKFKFDSTQA